MSLVTKDNISEAVASADEHYAHAALLQAGGQQRLATKHKQHADAIMRTVMFFTKPKTQMSDDELLAELTR